MTIPEFIASTNLDRSILIGYYGGGNYGDELLLEILQNLLHEHRVKHVAIAYQRPENFAKMHHDLGYAPFDVRSKSALLKQTLAHQTIIVGGGGLWGVDMNRNTFLMSLYLLLSRWLLGKKVFLIGVGYYRSTSWVGHVAAWLAGFASSTIIVRDEESLANFRRVSSKTYMDVDLAWYARKLNLYGYAKSAHQLGKRLGITKNTLFVSLRRPQAKQQHDAFARWNDIVQKSIRSNVRSPIVVTQLELPELDARATTQIKLLANSCTHVSLLEMPINPLVLFALFHEYSNNLKLVGPQFHLILTAHLNHVPFLPIAYDNKVCALLESLGIGEAQQIALPALQPADIQGFIDMNTPGQE